LHILKKTSLWNSWGQPAVEEENVERDLNLPVCAGVETSATDQYQEMPQRGYSRRSLKIPNVTGRPISSISKLRH
jgi:hypothetical protein